MQVPVSIIDLLGVSLHRNEPVSELYGRHYVLGLFSNDRDDWIRTVAVCLKKPCPFLADDLCGIYPVRPLPCMLFPEYLVSRGTFTARAAQEQFRKYLCLKRPLKLSPERAQVVAKLRRMFERELLLSSYYLFNHGLCHVDCGDFVKELLPAGISLPDQDADEGAEQKPLPSQALKGFFQERLAGCPPFAGVDKKIDDLDTQEGQVKFLELFRDELLYKKLRQAGDDRALVFQFTKGKVKARRRGIIPTEYKFY